MNDPNDLMDLKNIYFDLNPYNLNEMKRMKAKDFEYKKNENSIFEANQFTAEIRAGMCRKPTELKAIREDQMNDREPKTGQPYYVILDVLAKFEKFCVIDNEPLDFVVSLSYNNLEVLDKVKNGLQRLGIFKHEQSLLVYQTLFSLFCMSFTMSELKEATNKKDIPIPELKPLFSLIAIRNRIDIPASEAILMLSHGNLAKGFIKFTLASLLF